MSPPPVAASYVVATGAFRRIEGAAASAARSVQSRSRSGGVRGNGFRAGGADRRSNMSLTGRGVSGFRLPSVLRYEFVDGVMRRDKTRSCADAEGPDQENLNATTFGQWWEAKGNSGSDIELR